MLFMDIWTWEPEKRDEVEKRADEWKCPEEIREHGYWIDLTGSRAFYLYEVEDPKVILAANNYWTEIVGKVLDFREFNTLFGFQIFRWT